MRRLGLWCVMGLAAACGSNDWGWRAFAAGISAQARWATRHRRCATVLNRGVAEPGDADLRSIFSGMTSALPTRALPQRPNLVRRAQAGTVDLIGVEGTSGNGSSRF